MWWKSCDESEDEWLKKYDMPHTMEAIQEFRENKKMHGKHHSGRKKN